MSLSDCIVCTKTELNFIATVNRHTQYLYLSPVYQVFNVNWFAFLREFFRPSKVKTKTMAPMEGAKWAVKTWVCSH